MSVPSEAAVIAALLDALDRVEQGFRLSVNGRPVRDMTETLAEAAHTPAASLLSCPPR